MSSTIRGNSGFDTALPFVTEQGSDTNGYYRKWSNGFIEQWGSVAAGVSGQDSVTFPVPFTSADYAATVTFSTAFQIGQFPSIHYNKSGLTGVNVFKYYRESGNSTTLSANQGFSWEARGF